MKKIKELIKGLEENPRGKSVMFFAFYFVFFLILIVTLRFGDRKSYNSSDYESGIPYSFSLDKVLKKNYSFFYNIKLDEEENIYTGKRLKKKMSFSYKDKNYYYNGKKFFIKEKELLEIENPILFFELLDEDNLNKMISASSYESKTSYESGKTLYTFLISSNTINKLVNNLDSDYFEEPNKIVISTDNDNNVEDIHLMLDSYCSVNSLCEKSLDIKLSYADFGDIKDIEED